MFSWKHMGCWWGPHSACKLCEQKNKKMETNNIINKVNLLFIQLLSHVFILFNPMDCSMPSFPDRYFPELAQTHVHWVSDVIQPSLSVTPFSSCPQSFPVSGSFPVSQLFTSGDQSTKASPSASVPPVNIQGWFSLGVVWFPCIPRDSQESSPTPQFKSINSLALSFLYGPNLTSTHD